MANSLTSDNSSHAPVAHRQPSRKITASAPIPRKTGPAFNFRASSTPNSASKPQTTQKPLARVVRATAEPVCASKAACAPASHSRPGINPVVTINAQASAATRRLRHRTTKISPPSISMAQAIPAAGHASGPCKSSTPQMGFPDISRLGAALIKGKPNKAAAAKAVSSSRTPLSALAGPDAALRWASVRFEEDGRTFTGMAWQRRTSSYFNKPWAIKKSRATFLASTPSSWILAFSVRSVGPVSSLKTGASAGRIPGFCNSTASRTMGAGA